MMVIAFFASLTLYADSKREMYLRFFPLFLLICAALETTSDYLVNRSSNNLYISNPFTILAFSYYCLTIYWIIHNRLVKRIILGILAVYPAICLVNAFFIQKMTSFHTVTYSIGCLIIVALCIYYFFELFQQTRTVNLLNSPAFWICSGLLFYYTCSFPLYGVANVLYRIVPHAIIKNLWIVFQLLDVLLYLSFTIAFLCRLRVRKST